MNSTINEQWTPEAWEAMAQKLEELSLAELRQLVTAVGIEFVGGNDQIVNKQEIVDVLDEADRAELEEMFQQIIRSRCAP